MSNPYKSEERTKRCTSVMDGVKQLNGIRGVQIRSSKLTCM